MSLQMIKGELYYQRKNFYETLRVYGKPCKIHSIHNNEEVAYDFYNDIRDTETSYDGTIESMINYEEVPTIKTLKSLGWYVEDSELPVLGYLPVFYKNRKDEFAIFSPSVDDKVTICVNPYDENPSERDFLIKDFKGNGFPSAIYYTCKLVPYRK